MWGGAIVPTGGPIGAGILIGATPGILTLIGDIHGTTTPTGTILIGPTIGVGIIPIITTITIGMVTTAAIITAEWAVAAASATMWPA